MIAQKVIGILALVFLGLIGYGGILNSIHKKASNSTTEAATPEVVPQNLVDSKIRDFSKDSFKYENVSLVPYRPYSGAKVAGTLIALVADITNNGKSSNSPALRWVKLTDSKDNEFKEADSIATLGDKSPSRTDYILPGQTSKRVLLAVYDVLPDSKGFTLHVSNQKITPDQTSLEIGQ